MKNQATSNKQLELKKNENSKIPSVPNIHGDTVCNICRLNGCCNIY
jgi:hypothetical protein